MTHDQTNKSTLHAFHLHWCRFPPSAYLVGRMYPSCILVCSLDESAQYPCCRHRQRVSHCTVPFEFCWFSSLNTKVQQKVAITIQFDDVKFGKSDDGHWMEKLHCKFQRQTQVFLSHQIKMDVFCLVDCQIKYIQSIFRVKIIMWRMIAFVVIEFVRSQKQTVLREYELMLVVLGMNWFQALLLLTV